MAITRLYDINYDPASPDYVGGVDPPGAIKKLDENQKQIFSEFNNYLGDGTLRLPFSQTPIYVGEQDLMSRVFYVDAVNGDDNNPGTSGAPFKTLKKAIDSVPVGGYGIIYLRSDIVIDEDIFVFNKRIEIESYFKTIIASWKLYSGNYSNYPIALHSYASITLRKTKVYIPQPPDTNYPVDPTRSGLFHFTYSAYHASHCYFEFLAMSSEPITLIEVEAGNLIAQMGSSSSRKLATNSVVFSKYNYGEDVNIVIHSGARLMSFIGTLQLAVSDGWNLQSENGEPLSWSDVISGIIRDTNGVPRNVVSNIVL